MWQRLGRSGWTVLCVVSTLLGIGGWPDDASVWRGWIDGMSPVLSGFLMGAGATGIIAFVLGAKWQERRGSRTVHRTELEDKPPSGVVVDSLHAQSSSSSTAGSRESGSMGARERCRLTPAELVALAAGRTTDLARELALEPFKGKWLMVAGHVKNVSQSFGGAVSVNVVMADELDVCLWMKEERYSKEDLADVKKGEVFAAEGRFDSVSDSGLIFVRDCERLAG